MKYGVDRHDTFAREVEHAKGKASHATATKLSSDFGVALRSLSNSSECAFNLEQKFYAQARPFEFVPLRCLSEISFGFRFDDDHGRGKAARRRLRTSSHGSPEIGSAA